MESATLETLETTVAMSVPILGTSENPRNVTFYNNSGTPTLIHPLGQPQVQLGSSLRSRDGCEAPSKHRHQEKINIMESSGGYLCEQPSLNCEIISALRICRASLKAVDLEKCQHGFEILNLYSENFCRNIIMAMLIFVCCYSFFWGNQDVTTQSSATPLAYWRLQRPIKVEHFL